MRFKNIYFENENLDYFECIDGYYRGTNIIYGTDELIELADKQRKNLGFSDIPDSENDIYYNFYLSIDTQDNYADITFTVNHSEKDDFAEYEIGLTDEEQKFMLLKFIEFIFKNTIDKQN